MPPLLNIQFMAPIHAKDRRGSLDLDRAELTLREHSATVTSVNLHLHSRRSRVNAPLVLTLYLTSDVKALGQALLAMSEALETANTIASERRTRKRAPRRKV